VLDGGLLLLRVAAGLTVAAHGAQKLFGWFGGPGLTGFADSLESMGFRRTRELAWLAGLAEFGGGLLLALGLITPLATAALVGMMLSATLVGHRGKGFFAAQGGFELPLLLAVVAAAIALTGPGAYALDTVIDLPVTDVAWTWGAIVLGVVAAAVTWIAHRSALSRADRTRLQTA